MHNTITSCILQTALSTDAGCFHSIPYLSMIFKTNNKELVIFGKKVDEIKEKRTRFINVYNQEHHLFGNNGAIKELFKSAPRATYEQLSPRFEEFKAKYNNSNLSAEALSEEMGGVDEQIVKYAKTCKNGELTTAGFKEAMSKMTLSAKASTIAIKTLSMAGNMLVMWGVSAAISLVSNVINESRQRIQKNKEAVDSLSSSYKEGQKTLKSNRDTAESLKDKYAELAKGVDKTGSNLSLTTDEFKEYQNISNQLADMFPSLVSGWDAQGNAILKCKDNVDALGQAYKDAELKKASDFINDDTYGKILDNYQDQIAKKQYTAKLNILTKVQNSKDAYIEEFKRLSNEAKNGDEKSQELYSYMTTLGDIGEIFDDKGETIPEAVAKIDWNSIRHNISTQMSLMQTEINDGLQSVKQAGMAQLTTAMYGETISEENADLAARIINSIDSSLADGMGTDEDIIKNWAVKIVDILKDESSNSGIKEAFSEIFAFDSSNMTPEEMKSEIDKYVDTVKPFFKEVFNTEDDHQIKLSFGLGDIDALADDYQNAIKAAKKNLIMKPKTSTGMNGLKKIQSTQLKKFPA